MFFDGYKEKDVIEYKKIFLSEIKSFLPFFVKFFDDRSILFKVYLNNCAVGRLGQKLIIMITYDKSIFSGNDNCRKV